jgi:hypothetical protein
MAQDSGIFLDLRFKVKNMVHIGVQTLSSGERNIVDISEKLDAIID